MNLRDQIYDPYKQWKYQKITTFDKTYSAALLNQEIVIRSAIILWTWRFGSRDYHWNDGF